MASSCADALLAQLVVIGQDIVAFGFRERAAGRRARRISAARPDVAVRQSGVLFFDARSSALTRSKWSRMASRRRDCWRVGRRFGQIEIAEPKDDFLRTSVTRWSALAGAAGAFRARHFAALVDRNTAPGALGIIGDEIEFVPEPVEFLLTFLVEDQFDERRIVAKVAHHVVIAGARGGALVLRNRRGSSGRAR